MTAIALRPDRIRGALFDMDGLLLDTERVYRYCFTAACDELKVGVGEERLNLVWSRCIGTTDDLGRQILADSLGPDFPLDRVLTRWREMYARQIARGVNGMPGSLDLLRWLHAWRVPVGLVTSTQRTIAGNKLLKAGMTDYFRIMVCGSEAVAGKPDPAPYLLGAKLLGLPVADCLVLEDSDNGVRSAVAAGAQVVQVPDLVTPSRQVLELGHTVHASLLETLDLLTSSRAGTHASA